MVIDLDWNKDLEEGYMNRGFMRTLNNSIPIVGDNKKVADTDEIVGYIDVDSTKNKNGQNLLLVKNIKSVKSFKETIVALDSGTITDGIYTLSQSNTSGSGTGISVTITFENDKTTSIIIVDGGSGYAANDTVTFTNNNSQINSLVLTVRDISNNFSATGNPVIFINTKQFFSDNTETSYSNKLNVDSGEMNIITSVTAATNTITLKYDLLNNHNYENTVVIQRYKTSFVETQTTGNANIEVASHTNFAVGDIIVVDWNTKDASDNNIEEVHRISAKPGGNVLTLEQNLLHTHTTNCCVVNLGNTTIRDTMLSTQNILINNEWYTKVFYQGADCIEPNGNTEYRTGVPCFHKYAKQSIYINGMSGIQIPNMSLMNNRDAANTINNTSELDTTIVGQENFNIDQIKPLTAGFYETYPNLIRDQYGILTDYYNHTIPGNFTKLKNHFTSETIWNEKTTYNSSDNLEYNCILIKGKYLGYGGTIEFREQSSILENENGFKVLQKINESTTSTVQKKIILDLKISNINLDTKETFTSSYNDLLSSNKVPSSVLISNYQLLQTKKFLKQDITIGTGGVLYKKIKNGAIQLCGENYINLCFQNLNENTIQTTSKSKTNDIDIFAKILLPVNTGNILFNTFVPSIKIFDKPINLRNLHVRFLDNDGDEYDFQGKEHSFTLEIFQQINKLCIDNYLTAENHKLLNNY